MVFIIDFAAIIEGIFALLELVAHAVWGSLKLLFCKPPPGESRFHPKRLALATLPLVAAALVIGGMFWFVEWSQERAKRRWNETQAAADKLAAELAAAFAKDPDKAAPQPGPADVEDAWGQPLVVAFERGMISNTIKVTSPGHDGKFETWDDIAVTEVLMLRKREIAANAAMKLLQEVNDDD